MRRHIEYGKYLLWHKWYVFVAGLKLGVSVLAALHDLSKFRRSEWSSYARHFYMDDGTKRTRLNDDGYYDDPANDRAFDRAWLQHIQRNKHHPQHWVIVTWTPCGHSGRSVLLKGNGKAQCLDCGHQSTYDEMGPRYRIGGVQVRIVEMPLKYRLEMMADWQGAGQAQGTGDTLGWYRARGHRLPLGPKTRAWVEQRLGYVAEVS
jgi:hypothetical protein